MNTPCQCFETLSNGNIALVDVVGFADYCSERIKQKCLAEFANGEEFTREDVININYNLKLDRTPSRTTK